MKPYFRVSCAAVFAAAAAAQTANGLKADVSFLASDALQGRATPSPGLDVASEFIAAQFRRAGLEPAGDDGYFQTAPFANVTPIAEGLEITIEAGGKTVKVDKAAMGLIDPAGLDVSRAATLKVAPADLDSVTADQVRGKVLIVEVPGQRRMAALPDRLQPVLVILLRDGAQPVNARARLREARPNATVPILAVWDAAAKIALGSDALISAHIAAPIVAPVKLHNVIGVLRGADASLKDTYVLLTAHYDHVGVRGEGPGDHIYNGANDDASGTASVIEIAGALAASPRRPRRTIVFMTVFGEELGLVGSRYYTQHPVFPLARTVADLNLEQVGRTDVDGGSRVGLVNVTGFDFTTMTPVLRRAGEDSGVQVVKDEKNSDPYYSGSDNQSFADVGVPSHTLSVGYMFPDYHRPGDEWPKLDYENMARVDRAVALALFRIADSTEAPEWNKENPKTERYVKARESAGR